MSKLTLAFLLGMVGASLTDFHSPIGSRTGKRQNVNRAKRNTSKVIAKRLAMNKMARKSRKRNRRVK